MVSGRTGQAGLVARSHVVTELDVELDAVTTRLHATYGGRRCGGSSTDTTTCFLRGCRGHVTSLSLFVTYNVIYVVSLKRVF